MEQSAMAKFIALMYMQEYFPAWFLQNLKWKRPSCRKEVPRFPIEQWRCYYVGVGRSSALSFERVSQRGAQPRWTTNLGEILQRPGKIPRASRRVTP